MKRNQIGRWCAQVALAASLAQAGCAVVDDDAASAGTVHNALVTPGNLALGGYFWTCVQSSGAMQCWGHNGAGQLGYGNTIHIGDTETADTVGAVSAGGAIQQIAAGGRHTCALLTSGDVRCWGAADHGQLGYGNTSFIGNDELPSDVGVVSLSSDAVYIAAGYNHTCALLDTGLIQCWGENENGQLGYGHTSDIGDDEAPSTQSPVSAGGTVVQLVAGLGHTCALLDTGDVRCWGYASYGQIGYGNTTPIGDDESITSVGTVSVGGTVVQLAAGDFHTCALLDDGDVRCWGEGMLGRLGYGNTSRIGDNEPPSSAGDVQLGGTATQITARSDHTCALLDTGAVRCWGADSSHQLGYSGGASNIGDNEHPSSAGDVDVGGTVSEVAAGRDHTCAMLSSGAIRCWGSGFYGQLGYGNRNTIGDDEDPADAGDVPW